MKTTPVSLIVVAAAALAWMAAPALAGPKGGIRGGPGFGSRGHGAGAPQGTHGRGAEQRPAKPTAAHPAPKGDGDNQHGNKGGECRGLARAAQVAGEHGQEGRETASQHAAEQEQGGCD